jgi:hypothetical protein
MLWAYTSHSSIVMMNMWLMIFPRPIKLLPQRATNQLTP